MNKLSKEKRVQLVILGIITAMVLGGLWFGLISPQQDKLRGIRKKIDSATAEIDKVNKVARETDKIKSDLIETTGKLNLIEADMPSGDVYSWIVRAIKRFNVPSYNVDIPQYGIPVVADVMMLPNFPYKQALVTVTGTAYYTDLGRFLVDLENRYPYARVQNLSLQPGGGTGPDEKEKLSFRMEIVTLVKGETSDPK